MRGAVRLFAQGGGSSEGVSLGCRRATAARLGAFGMECPGWTCGGRGGRLG